MTLNGTVTSRGDKRHAGDLAEAVSGVKDVHNSAVSILFPCWARVDVHTQVLSTISELVTSICEVKRLS